MSAYTDTLQTLYDNLDGGNRARFAAWADDLYEDDPYELDLELFEDWIGECQLSIRDDGLVEFETVFEDEDCDVAAVVGDLPIVLYHHTATGAVEGIIERGGLVPALDIDVEPIPPDTGEWVYLTTELSGPVVNGYISRAMQRFGGGPLTLAIRTHLWAVEPDPDDVDLSVGQQQFVLGHVPLTDIVEGLGLMLPLGWTSPEYKEDSYIIRDVQYYGDRGEPVLVDVSMAHRTGPRLLEYVEDVIAGRRSWGQERPRDLGYHLRAEVDQGTLARTEVADVLEMLDELQEDWDT